LKNSKWISAALASTLLVSAGAESVMAATTSSKTSPNNKVSASSAAVKAKEGTVAWTVDGRTVSFKTLDVGGYKLYSLSQLAEEIGAGLQPAAGSIELYDGKGLHTIQLRAGSKSYLADGATHTFTVAPVVYKNKTYVQLTPIVSGLGGELQLNPNTMLSYARPAGEFDTLHWTSDGRIIANKADAETTQIFKLSTVQGNYEVFSSNDAATDFTVSPDMNWGAFTDEKGQLNLINLNSGAIKPLGTDTSVKTDLTWSLDGKKIYFIQGDKQEKIAQISVETGAVTEILADKVENKSALRISADEKTAVYIVNVTGVAKNDADSTEDSLTVDFSKAGEQIFKLALGTKDAKPVALTTQLDNKLYPEIQADGSIVYLSADPDGNTANVLKTIKPDASIEGITLDIEVTWSAKVSSGLIVAGTATDGTTRIYSLAPNGARTELYRTTKDIMEIAVSADGSKLAVVVDGRILVIQNGKALQLTK